jgi:hypothetical protein
VGREFGKLLAQRAGFVVNAIKSRMNINVEAEKRTAAAATHQDRFRAVRWLYRGGPHPEEHTSRT